MCRILIRFDADRGSGNHLPSGTRSNMKHNKMQLITRIKIINALKHDIK